MKTPLLSTLLLVTQILLLVADASGSWKPIPLKDRLRDADLIVVGRLSKIVERDFWITYSNKQGTKKPYTSYYDRGTIENPKLLKGEVGDDNSLSVVFDSKDQTRHPFRHMLISQDVGEEGIWLLRKDRVFTGHFVVVKPSNPLPLSAESKVLALLGR